MVKFRKFAFKHIILMSPRKQTNEVNRTRLRLGKWLDHHPQGPAHFTDTLYPMTERIADRLGLSVSVVGTTLTEPPLSIQVSAFLYEESLLRSWDGNARRPIDDYICKQVRRERPLGRRYVTALAKSSLRVLETVDVKPGSTVTVRRLRQPPNSQDKARRVHDVLASESITTRDFLLGRVIPMPEGYIFAASLLPLKQTDALALLSVPEPQLMHEGFVTWGVQILREFANAGIVNLGTSSVQPQRPAEVSDMSSGTHTVSAQHLDAEQKTTVGNSEETYDRPVANDAAQPDPSAAQQENQHTDHNTQQQNHVQLVDREKLLERIRKLFAMAQETEASPHEAEIALRRCQSLMSRYGITESDLHTSQFSSEAFRAGIRVPMHIKWLATAVEELHSVLFVTGGGESPEFRGFDIDVKVAKMTMDYLENATERSLATRRRSGTFPAGRSAAYDYRVSFAMEVNRRVHALVAERKAAEAAATTTGTALTVKKMEIVQRECSADLVTNYSKYKGARPGDAADAGRFDGSKVSLDPQVDVQRQAVIEQ